MSKDMGTYAFRRVAHAAAAVYEQVCLKALQYPQVGFSKLHRAFSIPLLVFTLYGRVLFRQVSYLGG